MDNKLYNDIKTKSVDLNFLKCEEEEEREMKRFFIDQGIDLFPWSLLARGFLTGNRTRADINNENNEKTSATKRAETDAFSHQLYYVGSDSEIIERLKNYCRHKIC
ncbi:unnamed protein product [Adineta steineri]|uniref:NADP-dependent oxidoreductase domain-containing protein n=1 Tax=Adineta steineri TaxID=433720 RepID=A0A813XPA3_9BILA|nr:unnamed protein product [Adineta steineri]CAF3803270.1 unnamed protein product [Adineta steineri]